MVATGICEIQEILWVEITEELLTSTDDMKNFCIREFVSYVFQHDKFKLPFKVAPSRH